MWKIIIALVLLSAPLMATEPAWEKLENCSLAPGYRDGDSFLVRIKPRTFRVFRLYFVDAPEDSADQRFPERIDAQAAYFGVTPERSMAAGDEAAAFTASILSTPFTVWTCWQKAPGASAQQRYFAMIETGNGDWLDSLLVARGLARIYGKRISLPDGSTSREHLAELERLEERAKTQRLGAWR